MTAIVATRNAVFCVANLTPECDLWQFPPKRDFGCDVALLIDFCYQISLIPFEVFTVLQAGGGACIFEKMPRAAL